MKFKSEKLDSKYGVKYTITVDKEVIVREQLQKRVNDNFAKMYHGERSILIDEKYRVKYADVTTEESDGLKAVKKLSLHKEAVVLMHDAVRPMIPSSLIDECIESVKCFNSGIAAVVCHETVASYKGEEVLSLLARCVHIFCWQAIFAYLC